MIYWKKLPPKKAKFAIALLMIIDSHTFDPLGFQAGYFHYLQTSFDMPRKELYARLEKYGYTWDGKRWRLG